jgi:hypothetical protein
MNLRCYNVYRIDVQIRVHLSIYGSTALRWALSAFSLHSSFKQPVGLLGRGISPSQGSYLHKG